MRVTIVIRVVRVIQYGVYYRGNTSLLQASKTERVEMPNVSSNMDVM